MENNRFVYTDEHPDYQKDPDLNWLKLEGCISLGYSSSFVTVVDTKTNIVYTGDVQGGSLNLGRDVKYFVKGK